MAGATRIAALTMLCASAALAPVGQGAPTPPPGVIYAGETPQFELVTAEVNPARDRVVRLVLGWSADCVPGPAATPTTGTGVGFTDFFRDFPINKAGRWSGSLNFQDTEGALTQEFGYKLSGVRTSAKLTGTLQVTYLEKDAAGQIVRTCTSPLITFKALERTVFGGLTVGQRNPVLVKLNVAGTQVRRIRWDWSGQCTGGPAATPETRLANFERDFIEGPLPIAPAGTFSRTLDYPPFADPQTGLTRRYSAKVVGRRAGRTIKGTLTAGFLETDTATGAIVRNCTSGPVKFATKD